MFSSFVKTFLTFTLSLKFLKKKVRTWQVVESCVCLDGVAIMCYFLRFIPDFHNNFWWGRISGLMNVDSCVRVRESSILPACFSRFVSRYFFYYFCFLPPEETAKSATKQIVKGRHNAASTNRKQQKKWTEKESYSSYFCDIRILVSKTF